MKPEVKWPPSGRYILAISGGADSMVLLDLMANAATTHHYELIVAHFDHGLRDNSRADRLFVQGAAKRYDLPSEHHEATLGQASEATARTARHAWLEQVRAARNAQAVVTAHHQDDLIETSLLNLARGTGRRGLAPMLGGAILRPLIDASRRELRDYAATYKIVWREDPTNADITNPRNLLRHLLLSAATPEWRQSYLEKLGCLGKLNKKVDQNISVILGPLKTGDHEYSFSRSHVRELSLPELEEMLMTAALHLQPGVEPGRRLIQELALFAKTASPGLRRPLRHGLEVRVDAGAVRLLGS